MQNVVPPDVTALIHPGRLRLRLRPLAAARRLRRDRRAPHPLHHAWSATRVRLPDTAMAGTRSARPTSCWLGRVRHTPVWHRGVKVRTMQRLRQRRQHRRRGRRRRPATGPQLLRCAPNRLTGIQGIWITDRRPMTLEFDSDRNWPGQFIWLRSNPPERPWGVRPWSKNPASGGGDEGGLRAPAPAATVDRADLGRAWHQRPRGLRSLGAR